MTSDERARIRQLERENSEVRRANEILRKASALSPRRTSIVDCSASVFVDEHRGVCGVEPICTMLPIAPLTYSEEKARQADPSRLSGRVQHDAVLSQEIVRVWEENRRLYGARRVWRQLQREGIQVARSTVERLISGDSEAPSAAGSGRRRSPTTLRPTRRTLSSATSPPLVRTSCGWRI